MRLLTIGTILISLFGCSANPVGKPDNIIRIDTDTTLDRDYTGTQFVVTNGSHLEIGGHKLVGRNKLGQSFNVVILHGNDNTVTNGFIEKADTCVQVASHLTQTDLQKLKDLSWEEARIFAINELIPNGYRRNRISGIQCSHSNKAVYVYPFVNSTTISNNKFSHFHSVAIYLDSGSNNNVIENNYISHAGEESKYFGREAIAVDASYDNIIKSNHFNKNYGFTTIALYQNCGEKGIARPMGADNNLILDNEFKNAFVGIYNSSRRKHRHGWYNHTCRADMPSEEQVNGTMIERNTFNNVLIPIRGKR